MARYLGLKRKAPSFEETRSTEKMHNPKALLSQLKRQPFRPPFTRLEDRRPTIQCAEAQGQGLPIGDATTGFECNVLISGDGKMNAKNIAEENMKIPNNQLLASPIVQKQGKENQGTAERKPCQALNYGECYKQCNVSESNYGERVKVSSGNQTRKLVITKAVSKGFSNTGFKPPALTRETANKPSILLSDKLKSIIQVSHGDSAHMSLPDGGTGVLLDDAESLIPHELGRRKSCISKSWLNPTKEMHKTCKDNPKNILDAKPTKIYRVFYCKRKKGTKPKGPWSDGILRIHEHKCTLQDADGKIITKADCKRHKSTSEGEILEVGKFYLEVVEEASNDEYNSGALFMRSLSPNCKFLDTVQKVSKRPNLHHSEFMFGRYEALSTAAEDLHKDAFVINAKCVEAGGIPIFIDPYLNTKLRPHQREGVKFIFECVMGLRTQGFTGCLLADEMGLGKTLQVITLIWTLLQQVSRFCPEFKCTLVVCPSSLVQNWGNEVRKWLGIERLKALVVHGGTNTKEVKQQFANFRSGNVHPLLITSYELLRKYVDAIGNGNVGLLVCDEAHRLKNCAGNKTIDALLALKCPRRILLTGTPVQNDLNEFYAMMDFANPNLLGPLSAFKRLYADPIERSRDRDASIEEKKIGQARSLELQSRTEFCIIRRSASINKKYLPLKTEYIIFCRPQPSQISLYLEYLKSKVVTNVIQSSNASTTVLPIIGILRKLCNHPKLITSTLYEGSRVTLPFGSIGNCTMESLGNTNKSEANQKEHLQFKFDPKESNLSGKLQCLDSLVSAIFETSSSSKDKLVIVSNFTQTLDMIQGLCDYRCWKCLRLDGTTDSSSRQQLVDHFNMGFGSEMIFLLSSRAGGTGLNLIGANRLILFDPDWNPAIDAQAMARVWRDGQSKHVIIYRLLTTGSIEEKIYQRQLMKCEIAAAIEGHSESVSACRKGSQHFSREELQELFTLHLDTSCDTYDLLSRSKLPNLEDWKDHSANVKDSALKHAIKCGIITFVRQCTESDKENSD